MVVAYIDMNLKFWHAQEPFIYLAMQCSAIDAENKSQLTRWVSELKIHAS